MKLKFFKKFSIALKIGVGYFFVLFIGGVGGSILIGVMLQSQKIDQKVTEAYIPYLDKVRILDYAVSNSGKLINGWVYNPNVFDKQELTSFHFESVDSLIYDLRELINVRAQYDVSDSLSFHLDKFDTIVGLQSNVMELLVTPQDYSNELKLFKAIPLLDDEIIPETRVVSVYLSNLLDTIKSETDTLLARKVELVNQVVWISIILIVCAISVIIIHFFFSIRTIVRPINTLNQFINTVSLGDLSSINIKTSNDEIGDMKESIVRLVENLKKKGEFAEQIGKGDIYTAYNPVSEKDLLGFSLLAMRDNLKQVILETNKVVEEAGSEGNLDVRITINKTEGAWKDLAESINRLLASVGEPIAVVTNIVNGLAEGDLTKRYEREAKGQIGVLTSSLNQAMDNLSRLIAQISEVANTVETSSTEMLTSGEEMNLNTGEIASSIGEMSNGAQKQVHKVDESSQLVESILGNAKEMGEKSNAINMAAQQGVNNSSKGSEIVNKVVHSISEISEFSQQTNESMQVLSKRSNDITKALRVITEIASQTNLLALNAAIEAAQAGDAGRGFAVVAEEIRKLAEDSRRSAKEIEAIVNGVQADTLEAVRLTETMNSNIKSSVASTKETADVFEEMATASAQTLRFSEEILKSTKIQEGSIVNVVSITESIVVIAEQTASGSEEIASSATELSSGMQTYIDKSLRLSQLAVQLKDDISTFKLDS